MFDSTRWSVIARAGVAGPGGRDALAELCEAYWQPLYAFLRRRGHQPAEAEDLVQGFLADLLARGLSADPERGEFRTWLLTALKHFAANQHAAATAVKRGGRVSLVSLDFAAAESAYQFEPADDRTPEAVFARQWALTLLARVLADLEAEQRAAGRGDWFEALRGTITTAAAVPYQQLADELGTTPGAVKTAASRLRRRYRTLLDAALADGLTDPADIAAERRALFESLASC